MKCFDDLCVCSILGWRFIILFKISEKKNVTGNLLLKKGAYYCIKGLTKNLSVWMEQLQHGHHMEEAIALSQSRVAL